MTVAVVAGAVASTARRGGDTWHRLHWLLGLRRLGLQVHLVEQIDQAVCTDRSGMAVPPRRSENLTYFRDVVAAFGIPDEATLIDERGESLYGLSLPELRALVDDAELLVNVSGHLDWQPLALRPRRTVFIDEDPGFTQMWRATGVGCPTLELHDWHYSVGGNVGTPASSIPTCGLQWRRVPPFATLDEWPVVSRCTFDRFTTVGSWRGPFGSIDYDGKTYGVKAHEFRRFHTVPQLTGEAFELALDIHPDETRDLEMLRNDGWRLVDPLEVAGDPSAFRSYVQHSGAEFSVAKSIYVTTNSGWFSDRTVRYLASGRPALVQDTGFSEHYPVGEGLLAFRTVQDAVDGAKRIVRDYAAHCVAARAIAEEHCNSDKVLSRLLDEVGVGGASRQGG